MAIAISIVSLLISALTFWMSRLKRGSLKMTRPSLICFTGINTGDGLKVVIRTLLFSTSDSGQYVQNMFVRVSKEETSCDFNVWAYDDKGLVRGSGVYVGRNGTSNYHHFLTLETGEIKLNEGEWRIEIFAETVTRPINKIFEYKLAFKESHLENLSNGNAIFFDWAPNTANYVSRVGNYSAEQADFGNRKD